MALCHAARADLWQCRHTTVKAVLAEPGTELDAKRIPPVVFVRRRSQCPGNYSAAAAIGLLYMLFMCLSSAGV